VMCSAHLARVGACIGSTSAGSLAPLGEPVAGERTSLVLLLESAMSSRCFESTAVFHELLDMLRGADQNFLSGPRAVDALSVVEGYRMLT